MDTGVVVLCVLLVVSVLVANVLGAYIPEGSPALTKHEDAKKCPQHCFCWADGIAMQCEFEFSQYSFKSLPPWQPTDMKILGTRSVPQLTKVESLRFVVFKVLSGDYAPTDRANVTFSLLRQLDISYVPIGQVAKEDFTYLTELRILNIANNGIQSIGPHAFADVPMLQVLNLNGNLLTSLTTDMLFGLKNLKKLHLDGNLLKSLPADVFSTLRSLEYLSMNRNQLESIDVSFDNMTALDTLDFSENEISFVENETVSHLLTVGNVYLGRNPLQCSCISKALISAVQQNTSIHASGVTCSGPGSFTGESFLSVSVDSLPCDSAEVEEISPSLNILHQGSVDLRCSVNGSTPRGLYWVTPWGEVFAHESTRAKFPMETWNAVQAREVYGKNLLVTTKVHVTSDGSLHIENFRGSFAGTFTCVSVNKIGQSNSTVYVGIKSMVKPSIVTSLFIGAYCSGSMFGVAVIIGAVRYFVNKCLHKEGCHCCCCRTDDSEVDSTKFEEEVVEVTYSTGSLDESDFDSEFPPPDPPMNSPLRRKSPEKCRTPPDDGSDMTKGSPHIWEQLDEVRSRLRYGAGRKIEKVRSHVRSITDTGTLKIREFKDAGTMKIQSIRETSSQAASRVRKNVASGMVQVKYGVQSIKEFCGTGEMGPGTISMISVSTDVDTKEQVKIVKSHTFV